MHLELPKVRLDSLKDFLKHYLMIVLSILTALGLEAWIEHTHHEHAAQTADAQIEAELRANLADIRRIRDADAERLDALKHLEAYLVGAVKGGVDADIVRQHVDAQTDGSFYLGLQLPRLRHEAWDVAVANQAAGWLDTGKLRRYATIYTYQSDFERRVSFNTSLNLSGSRVNDIDADLQAGKVEPRELLRTVNAMASSVSDTVTALTAIEKAFERELPRLSAATADAR
jgi:hypothetical protein